VLAAQLRSLVVIERQRIESVDGVPHAAYYHADGVTRVDRWRFEACL